MISQHFNWVHKIVDKKHDKLCFQNVELIFSFLYGKTYYEKIIVPEFPSRSFLLKRSKKTGKYSKIFGIRKTLEANTMISVLMDVRTQFELWPKSVYYLVNVCCLFLSVEVNIGDKVVSR